jgi:hypothetical protein
MVWHKPLRQCRRLVDGPAPARTHVQTAILPARNEEAVVEFEHVLVTPDNALAQETVGGLLQLLYRDAEADWDPESKSNQ